jgi:hypothetical protein
MLLKRVLSENGKNTNYHGGKFSLFKTTKNKEIIMNKYNKKRCGHFINITFSVLSILFCVACFFILSNEFYDLFWAAVAVGVFILMFSNIKYSFNKLVFLKTIKHKFI